MNTKKYVVYEHVNKINKKVYVGITGQTNYKKRWGYGSGYIKQTKFYNAIKKYGWDNFEHIILYSNLSLEEACKIEKDLIKQFDSINAGYNINEGGELITYTHSAETVEKLQNLIWITDGIKNKRIDHTIDSVLNYPGFVLGYTITERQKEYQKNRVVESNKKKALYLAKWLSEKHTCKTCGKVMTEYYGNGNYCCKTCAVTHNHSEETKKLLSKLNCSGACGNKGKHFSDEHKQKIGNANRGKHRTAEQKERVSLSKKGQIPWNKGKHLVEKRCRINNGKIEKNILLEELQNYLDNGWQKGRLMKGKNYEK